MGNRLSPVGLSLLTVVALTTPIYISGASKSIPASNTSIEPRSEKQAEIEVLISGSYGDGENQLKPNYLYPELGKTVPSTISVDSAGNIYISDSLRLRVMKFNRDHQYTSSIVIGKGRIGSPHTIHNIAVDHNDNVYILSGHERKLFKFNKDGQLRLSIDARVDDPEMANPVEVDHDGRIYVAVDGELIQYDKEGHLIQSWKKWRLSDFFIDRNNSVYFQKPNKVWAKYENGSGKLTDVDCKASRLRGYDPFNKNECLFPPIFSDIHNYQYFIVYDRAHKRSAIQKCNQEAKCKTYILGHKKNFYYGYGSVEFDKEGNLYVYEIQGMKYRILRLSFGQ